MEGHEKNRFESERLIKKKEIKIVIFYSFVIIEYNDFKTCSVHKYFIFS